MLGPFLPPEGGVPERSEGEGGVLLTGEEWSHSNPLEKEQPLAGARKPPLVRLLRKRPLPPSGGETAFNTTWSSGPGSCPESLKTDSSNEGWQTR